MTPNTLVHNTTGKSLVVESGGSIVVKSGGTLDVQSGATVNQPAGGITLANISFTGLKVLAADGVDASGANADITLTGAVIGDRLILANGILKDESAANSFLPKVPGTHFEAVVTQTDKLVQLKAAGDLKTSTYFFVFAPAAAAE